MPALLAALFLFPASASAAVPGFGFSGGTAEWENYMPDAAAARADVMRVPLDWAKAREMDGTQDFLQMDDLYAGARAFGMTPQIVLWGPAKTDPETYAGRAAEVARRYPDAVIELWNEPNLEMFGGLTPDETIAVCKAAARAVHRINPEQKIVGPTVAPVNGYHFSSPPRDWEQWTRKVYRGLPKYVNLGLHLYPGPNRPLRYLKQQIRSWKRLGRGIDVSEIGMRAEYFTNQARMSARAYTRLSNLGVESIVFHSLAEGEAAGSKWEQAGQLWAIDAQDGPTTIYRALKRARKRDLAGR